MVRYEPGSGYQRSHILGDAIFAVLIRPSDDYFPPYVQNLLTESKTFFNLRTLWRRSQVAKAAVCKTAIRGFDSHRRLLLLLPFSNLATFRHLRFISRQLG